MYCSKCGAKLPDDSKFCSKCGSHLDNSNSVGNLNSDNMACNNSAVYDNTKPQMPSPQKKKKWIYVVIAVVLMFLLVKACSGGEETNDAQPSNPVETSDIETSVPSSNVNSVQEGEKGIIETDWLKEYANSGTDVKAVDADILYRYGIYYENQVISTVITVEEKGNDVLKASTSSNDSYFFSLVMNFSDEQEIERIGIEENDTVAIVGVVEPLDSTFGDTVTVNNCHIISFGDEATEFIEEYLLDTDSQIKFSEELKASYEQAKAEELLKEKQTFIDSCQTVVYEDVERNPNTYEETNIKVTGTVIQVSEGLFDSVTLRVEENGNIWYVTYSRKDENEARILEDDYVTIYGTCTGIKSYTSVLGSSITIPSLQAEYIDIS